MYLIKANHFIKIELKNKKDWNNNFSYLLNLRLLNQIKIKINHI